MSKLSVTGVVGLAYATLWVKRKELLILLVPLVLASWIISLGLDAVVSAVLGDGVSDSGFFLLTFQLVLLDAPFWLYPACFCLMAGSLAVAVVFSVAWFRVCLHLEPFSMRNTFAWRGLHTKFLVACIKVTIVYFLLSIIPGVFVYSLWSDSWVDRLAVLTPASVFIIWCLARLSVRFPATAAGDFIGTVDTFSLTRGNGWRLFWISIFSVIPTALLVVLVFAGLSAVLETAFKLDAESTFAVENLNEELLTYAVIAISASAYSIAYNRLRKSENDEG